MTAQPPFPSPVPIPNLETQPFWDATARGVLLLPRCDRCATVIWYPRTLCPACHAMSVTWFEASGLGTIYTFTVSRRGTGDWAGIGPYVVAYVELDEGPRVLTNIVDCDPDSVHVGQRVSVVFHDTGEGTALYRFRPV